MFTTDATMIPIRPMNRIPPMPRELALRDRAVDRRRPEHRAAEKNADATDAVV